MLLKTFTVSLEGVRSRGEKGSEKEDVCFGH